MLCSIKRLIYPSSELLSEVNLPCSNLWQYKEEVHLPDAMQVHPIPSEIDNPKSRTMLVYLNQIVLGNLLDDTYKHLFQENYIGMACLFDFSFNCFVDFPVGF